MWHITCIAMVLAGQTPQPALLDSLGAAPDSLEIDGQKLKLDAFLWRDFMPVAPPDGKPLVGVVSLSASERKPFPKGLKVETVWVIRGKDVWTTPANEVRRDAKDTTRLKITVRNGPKWGPGQDVDVVIRLRDFQAKAHLLRASKQKIQRTD